MNAYGYRPVGRKTFELMDYPLSKHAEVRKLVLDWAKERKYEVVRIWYGVEEEGSKVDKVTVEYRRID